MSYRKSFRTHAYASVWRRAERMLADADQWIFVGYSLPEADYELKHLLKVAQLQMADRSTRRKKIIDVVVKGGGPTCEKFKQFFGPDAVTCHTGGLKQYVARLNMRGAINKGA